MNPIRIKELIKNSDYGTVNIHSYDFNYNDKLEIELMKLKKGEKIEITKGVNRCIIRCEKGSLLIGTDYINNRHGGHYEYIEKGQIYIIQNHNYYELSCEKDKKATVTIITLS
jgi:hypothetical protein